MFIRLSYGLSHGSKEFFAVSTEKDLLLYNRRRSVNYVENKRRSLNGKKSPQAL